MNNLTVAIPTLGREQVLLDTINHLLAQSPRASEILILDQTLVHLDATEAALSKWHANGSIRWLRLSRPSIPAAMNRALIEATGDIVLFLDDDIIPEKKLIEFHVSSHKDNRVWAVAGQVLQPGEIPQTNEAHYTATGFNAFLNFPFNSSHPAWIENGMAGNLSVRRERAIGVGGFDENFIGVAYRFETEFCRRLCKMGGRIRFQPNAVIHHLRASGGGTRTYGGHMCSASPLHGVGDYYFALRQGWSLAGLGYIAKRPFREISSRFHLKHPWCIPVKLIGEIRALGRAVMLHARGPSYIKNQ